MIYMGFVNSKRTTRISVVRKLVKSCRDDIVIRPGWKYILNHSNKERISYLNITIPFFTNHNPVANIVFIRHHVRI